MKYRAAIYSLKRQYGVQATLVHVDEPQVDVITGSISASETTTDLGTIIILPSKIMVASFGALRTKDHPSGAFYLRHELIGLIDRKSLYTDINISVGDRINSYAVAGILNLYGELFIEVGLSGLSKDSI